MGPSENFVPCKCVPTFAVGRMCPELDVDIIYYVDKFMGFCVDKFMRRPFMVGIMCRQIWLYIVLVFFTCIIVTGHY